MVQAAVAGARENQALRARGHQRVYAGTARAGNGSLHHALVAAAERAVAAGVQVRRASRCLLGGVVGSSDKLPPSAGTLTAVQARIELMLDLLAERSH